MSILDNATAARRVTLQLPPGVALGGLGILVFSFTLPATHLALAGFSPLSIGFDRAVIAAALALVALRGAPRPSRAQLPRLAVVAGGVVLGFPLLTSLALQSSSPAHGAVIVAVLPAVTAVFAVLRGGERPGPLFWVAAVAGGLVVAGFALSSAHGRLTGADALELAAVFVCALGYAEGGALARELGGARTICWALVLALPITLPGALLALGGEPQRSVGAAALFGLAYLSVGSMFLGFFAWYAGLARGGIARVGQIQLIQPLLTVGWSALVLGERVTPLLLATAAAVLLCVLASQRARITGALSPPARPERGG